MMKALTIFISFSFWIQPSLAGVKSKRNRLSKGELSGQYVHIHKGRINKKRVQRAFPDATVTTPTDRMRNKRKGMLSLRDREIFFKSSGLNRYTDGMDSLGKDLLMFRLEKRSVTDLKELYSKIPRATLGRAKKNLKRFNKI